MLQSLNSGMNSKILRALFGVLLLSALLGLVMTDVGGFFRNGGFQRTDLVRVGKTELTVQQFDPLYRRQLQSSNIPPEQARQIGLANMILQQEITRQVMLQAASRVGIHVSNQYVANNLKKELQKLPVPGSDKDKLDAVLRNMGMSEYDFVEAIRSDTAAHVLSNTINGQGLSVPPATVKTVAAAGTQKRQADIITVRASDLPAPKAADDKALQAYLKDNADRYEIPEQRTIAVAVIKQSAIVPKVEISDADIESYYNDNKDQFAVPPRVKFIQVLATDEKAANKIYADAQKSGLANAAKTAKARLIDSDWYEEQNLPDTIAKVVFAKDAKAQKGLTKPVQSPLGWHIIETQDFAAASTKPLAEAKPQILDLLKQEKTDSVVNDVTEDIEQQAADGVAVAKIAEPYKGITQNIEALDRFNMTQKLEQLKLPKDVVANVQDAIQTLNEGDVSPIIESKDGAYVLVQLSKVTPPRVPEFASIKAKLATDWAAEQRANALDQLVDKVIGDYDIKKPDVKGLADKYKLAYRQTAPLAKDAKDLPEAAMGVLFNLSPQNDLTSVKTADGALIIRLASVKLDDPATIKVDAKQVEDIRATYAQELQQQFVMGWRDYLGVDINQALLDQTYLKTNKDQ